MTHAQKAKKHAAEAAKHEAKAKAARERRDNTPHPEETEDRSAALAWAAADTEAIAHTNIAQQHRSKEAEHKRLARESETKTPAKKATQPKTQETGDEKMSKQTKTTDTQTLVNATVLDNKHQGEAFIVVAVTKGWATLEDENGKQHKARPSQLTLVETEDEDRHRSMAKTLQQYKAGYEESVAYSGAKSQNNGDDVAHLLAGLTPEAVMAAAEKLLGLERGELAAKYDHLNPGQKRMNSGNRIRSAVKRGDVVVAEVEKAIKSA